MNNDVRIHVNGVRYSGWKTFSMKRSMQAICGTFSMDVVDKWLINQAPWRLKPGDEIEVFVSDQLVLTGFIDDLKLSGDAKSRGISISGRDKACDLVDCSIVDTAVDFKDQTLLGVFNKFCQPYGIKVTSKIDLSKVIPKISIKAGESIHEFIDREAARAGFLLKSLPDGNLEIVRAGKTRSSTELIWGKNLKRVDVTFNNKNRFSKYIVKGQAKVGKPPKGEATDKGISRNRPKLIVSDSVVDQDDVQKQAEWEASKNAAKAMTVSATIPGWHQADGELWETNLIVYFESEFHGVKADLLISDASLKKDKTGGTITELQLIRPDAYEPKKVVEKDDDKLSSLGGKS